MKKAIPWVKFIHESDSDNEIIFERTNWPNRNRNFKLLPGTYEIRL